MRLLRRCPVNLKKYMSISAVFKAEIKGTHTPKRNALAAGTYVEAVECKECGVGKQII